MGTSLMPAMQAAHADLARYSHFGFLALPRFSMAAFANAVEPLRVANHVAGSELYHWSLYSLDGGPIAASNGVTVAPTLRLEESALPDVLFVCGGTDVPGLVTDELPRLLRRLASRRQALGALCTGTYVLARAGLLDGYRCAVNSESLREFSKTFPRVVFTHNLFVIDRDRYTCMGGVAPIDLMLQLITPRLGRVPAAGIAEVLLLERIRDGTARQHMPLSGPFGGIYPSIAQTAQLMEANIEEPLSLEELAGFSGKSKRQLQRLFRRDLGLTPVQYYVTVRLHRARELLRQTSMSIMDISVACGFRSCSHFSRSYRAYFGHAPTQERSRDNTQSAADSAPTSTRRARSLPAALPHTIPSDVVLTPRT